MQKFRKSVLLVCAVCTLFISGCSGLSRNTRSFQIPQGILDSIDKNHEIVDAKKRLGSWFIACRDKTSPAGTLYIYCDSMIEFVESLPTESSTKEIKLKIKKGNQEKIISMQPLDATHYVWIRLEQKALQVAGTPKK
jgi:hypothetical protein